MEEEFVVRKYASVLVARGNLKRTFHRAVTPLSEYEPDFVRVAKEMTSQNSVHDVILVDKVLISFEPHCEKTCLWGLRPVTRYDTNRTVQPQKMARGFKFRI